MLRVLHILQRMEPAGVQTLLMNLYQHIDRKQIQFDFLVHYQTHQFFDDVIKNNGGRIFRFSVREDYNFIKYVNDLKLFFRTHPEYKIVHGHMHSLGALYLNSAKHAGIPIRIAHSHTNGIQNDPKKFIKTVMNRQYGKYATDLFACSYDAGRYMFGNKDFRVINNAIDSEVFRFDKQLREIKRNELGLGNSFVVGSVGRFTIQKNQIYSIDVFEKLLKIKQNAILLLIGSGPMEEKVKEYVKAKCLEEKVRFLGNRGDMPSLYMAMDIFLFPSLFEGLGIVGVEAQAAGTPVVCTDSLPKEINVSPLIYRLPLGDLNKWVHTIQVAADSKYAHTDMREYIKKAHYDIKDVTSFLSNFYLQKANLL